MRGKRVATLLLALGALSACSGGEGKRPTTDGKESGARSEVVSIVHAPGAITATWLAADTAYGVPEPGRRERLAAGINTLLIANLAPAAVPAPGNGEIMAYNSWVRTAPAVRIRNVRTDEDDVLDRGAHSVAWRSDGVLAYFKALRAKLDTARIRRYVGHIVVRSSLRAQPVRWTPNAGRYVVAGWAGERLLAYRLGRRWPDLLVLDRPGRERVLSRAAALVAVSPDGSRAFVSAYGASPPAVRVVELADGRAVSQLTLRDELPGGGPPVRFLLESGSWVDDVVVAAGTERLVLFSVDDRQITVEQVLRFSAAEFPLGVFEPQLLEDGRTIVAWAQLPQQPRAPFPDAAVLACDRVTLECARGQIVSAAVGPRLVYNPSRP